MKYVQKDKLYYDYIVDDVLGNLSGITRKAMFDEWAIYKSGAIFGTVVVNKLYFKVDINFYLSLKKLTVICLFTPKKTANRLKSCIGLCREKYRR